MNLPIPIFISDLPTRSYVVHILISKYQVQIKRGLTFYPDMSEPVVCGVSFVPYLQNISYILCIRMHFEHNDLVERVA